MSESNVSTLFLVGTELAGFNTEINIDPTNEEAK
ncbi:hypothetical protein P3T40_000353 [Paraburkholderia sp. EB58]|jgi:hypothetical protein